MRSAVFLAPGLRVRGDEVPAGVGGTVAATVLQAEALAARGWAVTVASTADGDVTANGVRYVPMAAAPDGELRVLVNQWTDAADRPAGRRVFLYHDTRPGGQPDTARCAGWADCSFVCSPFSRTRLPADLRDRFAVIPLPVRTADYAAGDDRPNRLLYSSVPDRGLAYLAGWFPRVRAAVPDAELHVTGDFTLYGWPSGRAGYERLFAGVAGVRYHGRVTRPELIALQSSAKVLAFPCTFPEGFCLAAAEAMAAGVVPVTSDAFALSTTVGPAGVLVPGHPGGGRRRCVQRWLYGRRFVRAAVRLLTDEPYRRAKAAECRKAAAAFAPDVWADRFLAAVG